MALNEENNKAKIGCEEYLYKEMPCCLHPCPALECPEPMCALDFPGGIKAYLRYKQIRSLLESTRDINKAAEILGVTPQTIQRRYNQIRSFA